MQIEWASCKSLIHLYTWRRITWVDTYIEVNPCDIILYLSLYYIYIYYIYIFFYKELNQLSTTTTCSQHQPSNEIAMIVLV